MFFTLSNLTLTFTDAGDDDDNCCCVEDEMAWLSSSPDIICIAS
jgi:hypothetical protein